MLAEVLPEYLKGAVVPEEQDETATTYTRKFTDADALVDLQGDVHEQLRKIRAFDRGPRAYYLHDGKRVIITEAEVVDGALNMLKVIPEGKKEMPYEDFRRS